MGKVGGSYSYNAVCDVCGFKFKASDLKKRWDGMMVCSADFEQRHPMDFYRVKNDAHTLPFTRPEYIASSEIVPIPENSWSQINTVTRWFADTNYYNQFHYEYLTRDLDLIGVKLYFGPEDLNYPYEHQFAYSRQGDGVVTASFLSTASRRYGKGALVPKVGWNSFYFADYNIAEVQGYRGQEFQFMLRRMRTPGWYVDYDGKSDIIENYNEANWEHFKSSFRQGSPVLFRADYSRYDATTPPTEPSTADWYPNQGDRYLPLFMGIWKESTLSTPDLGHTTGLFNLSKTLVSNPIWVDTNKETVGNAFTPKVTRTMTHFLVQNTQQPNTYPLAGKLSLWNKTAGTLIETVDVPTVPSTLADQGRWNKVALGTPRTLTAGTEYFVTYWNNQVGGAKKFYGNAWTRATNDARNTDYFTLNGMWTSGTDDASPTLPTSDQGSTKVVGLDIITT